MPTRIWKPNGFPVGEGDCDKDKDCSTNLKCGTDNCDSSIFGPTWDCCYDPNDPQRKSNNETTIEFNFYHRSTLAIREYLGTILQFNNFELISHDSLTYECPLSFGSMYFYVLGKCYFVDMTLQSYNDAKENCKTKFGNYQLGRLFEPKTLESSQEITNAAKIVSGKTYLWIGITVRPGTRNWVYTSGGALSFSGMIQSYTSQVL